MRLFLFPVSRKRILLYCDKIYPKPKLTSSSRATQPGKPAPASLRDVFFPPKPSSTSLSDSPSAEIPESTILDRATDFAAATWTKWEREPSGVQKRITVWGNALLRRIPYEEWALKSLPPLAGRRKAEYEKLFSNAVDEAERRKLLEKTKVKVLFPLNGETIGGLREDQVKDTLKRLATERHDLHWRRMVGSLIGAPLTLPFALVPVIPNIPGFYLLFRAWSHWRALSGAKHLQFLVEKDLVEPVGDVKLAKVYERAKERIKKLLDSPKITESASKEDSSGNDVMLLDKTSSSEISDAFGVPEMQVEIERAIEQVEKKLSRDEKEKAA